MVENLGKRVTCSSYANSFSTLGGMLSGPIALKGLRESSFFGTLDGYVAN